MIVKSTRFDEVKLIEPAVHDDHRGSFYESYNRRELEKQAGIDCEFVQDNHSVSGKGVLRGMHYQLGKPQAKLIRVTAGEIFDVVIDMRQSSPSFGRWDSVLLSSTNCHQLWIPHGFAHGFLVLSDGATVSYKTSDYYSPADERAVLWNDELLAIDWPLAGAQPVLSDKDASAVAFGAADYFS